MPTSFGKLCNVLMNEHHDKKLGNTNHRDAV